MDFLRAVCGCLTSQSDHDHNAIDDPNTQDTAISILSVLYNAEKPGQCLERAVNDLVGSYGWTESLAEAILNQLQHALKQAIPMGQAMKDAFDKSMDAAIGFAHDHPVFCTLIALGILVLLAPWVIEVLGFGELGPIEGTSSRRRVVNSHVGPNTCVVWYLGTFAALWQARYAGYVPKGSLFAFLQRLGMVWKH